VDLTAHAGCDHDDAIAQPYLPASPNFAEQTTRDLIQTAAARDR
jgi:hypothetical protein